MGFLTVKTTANDITWSIYANGDGTPIRLRFEDSLTGESVYLDMDVAGAVEFFDAGHEMMHANDLPKRGRLFKWLTNRSAKENK
jgi:hypothetical protein